MTARPAAERRHDVLARLAGDVDAWVASASEAGDAHLVPLSFVWNDDRLTFATGEKSVTVRNLRRTGRARLALGHTRDVVLVDGVVDFEAPVDVPDELADAYTTTGWDPRESPGNVFVHVRPVRIQAWRTLEELSGRDVMRDGQWLS